MSVVTLFSRFLPILLIGLVGPLSTALADTNEDRYFQAYYLETAKGDWAGAAKLYAKVAEDRKASKSMRDDARARLAACREELASRDFASLMPPNALAYVELNQPGKQVANLLGQLGLLSDGSSKASSNGQRRVSVSPTLIKEVLGLGGVAVAITGFDPEEEKPSGVAILHPGNLEVVRGLLETALPIAAQTVDSIGGFETYNIENEVWVTLTSRLVIASTERSEIEGVIDRLSGKDRESLASNAALAEVRKDGDALFTFFVNAKPLLPLIHEALASEGMNSRELAMAKAILDLDSLSHVMGRLAVTADGLTLDLGLGLDEGHHNLVYNFLRTPALNRETLMCVPEGAAVVIAGALNEADSRYSGGSGGDYAPFVTALDIGREIFANVTSFALFVLPTEDGRSESGPPIPDVALALTVNDPGKSKALWTQILGLVHLAGGGNSIQGESLEIGGVAAQQFKLPNGIGIFFANSANDVFLSPSRSAIARAIRAKRKGRSILQDKAFTSALSGLSSDTTKVAFIHAGRAAAIAKRFVPPHELKEAAPVLAMLSDTVFSFAVKHSDRQFLLSAQVAGIPDVSELVSHLVTQEFANTSHHSKRQHATRTKQHTERPKKIKKAKKTKKHARVIATDEDSANLKDLLKKFEVLAVQDEDREAAMKCAKRLFRAAKDDANALNGFAWALLTEDRYDGKYNKLALKCSTRSNELSDVENWAYVDTLALAMFRTGDADHAVALEKKAIELCGDCLGLRDLKKALKRFEEGL